MASRLFLPSGRRETVVNLNKDRSLAGKSRRKARKGANRESFTRQSYDPYKDPEYLTSVSVPELLRLAKGLGLSGYSRLKKAELVQLIANC